MRRRPRAVFIEGDPGRPVDCVFRDGTTGAIIDCVEAAQVTVDYRFPAANTVDFRMIDPETGDEYCHRASLVPKPKWVDGR
jgi:hypothetical protein